MFQHAGEIEPFAEWLAARGPADVIEVGTLHGGTAALWHGICGGRVISIDLPDGAFGGAAHQYSPERCVERTESLMEMLPRFVPILLDSQQPTTAQEVAQFLPEPADLLFLDGDHTLRGVLQDLTLYGPMVRSGGVIAFHDILDTQMHRRDGVEVNLLWNALPGDKHVWSVNGSWGGIGALIKP